MKALRLHILLAFLFVIQLAYAGNSSIRFKRITISDGLSLSSVYCIHKDSKGYMWFGTEDGLNRFDGENFKIYRANQYDTNSISYKWIEKIFEDSNGNLWLGSRGGLTFFNPQKEVFRQFKYSKTGNNKISNDTITCIFQPGAGILLAGTLNGLNLINLETNQCSILSDIHPELSGKINAITRINENLILIGTSNGMYSYSLNDGSIRAETVLESVNVIKKQDSHLFVVTNNALIEYKIQETNAFTLQQENIYKLKGIENIYIDMHNQVWAVTNKGLSYLDNKTKTINKLIETQNISHSLAIGATKPITSDNEGNLWFGTYGSGVYKINPQTRKSINHRNNPVNPSSISENTINCIYNDPSGTLWFGSFGAGISAYNSSWQKFKLLKHNPLNTNSLSSDFVWSILEDSNNKIWVGTNNEGITIYDPAKNSFMKLEDISAVFEPLSQLSIRNIFQDKKGYIWVGTDGNGLYRINILNNTYIHFLNKKNTPGTISNNSVRVTFEDSKGQIWIGTRNGLNRYNKQTNNFTVYQHNPDDIGSISHNFIYSVIHEDKNGHLWIGTYGGGLNKFNPETELFKSYKNVPNQYESISDNIVFSIYENDKGEFWIGTNSGLNLFNPNTERFKHYGTSNGLPNDVIYGVLPGNNNNLWLSTNLGICQFNTTTGSTHNFTVSDGLQSNEFNGGAFHKGDGGSLYFGGVYGLNILNPNKIELSSNESEVVFTKLEILGREVIVYPTELNTAPKNTGFVFKDSTNYYIHKHISYLEEITLKYNYRNFALEFNNLDNPLNNNSFAYFVEGIDSKWNYSGNRNYISFANLPHGIYIIRVKARDENGSWNTQETQLKVTIKPPFYKTWWFIVLECLIIGLFAFSLYKFLVRQRTYKILKAHNSQLNNAYNQLKDSEQALSELNSTKDKFFSIISHDLKNPFTSLMSISEMMKENFALLEDEEKQTGIERINNSIENIYNLLQNLLTWSRSQSGRIDFNPTAFNISMLLQENTNLFKLSADKKNIRLLSNFNENLIALGDREMINTVVRNLLNNAIKFTPEGKSVKVNCDKCNGTVCVTIEDEGVGIPEESLNKLFKIDQKVKTKGTAGEKGTGLGLIICQEFIEKNGGKIKVSSNINSGSTFTFSLPSN